MTPSRYGAIRFVDAPLFMVTEPAFYPQMAQISVRSPTEHRAIVTVDTDARLLSRRPFVSEVTLAKRKKTKNLSPAGNDLDAVGKSIAKMRDVKRRLIEACIAADDIEFACGGLALALTTMKLLRHDLEAQLRNRDLDSGMTPEKAQEAIYAMQLMEAEMLASPWERSN